MTELCFSSHISTTTSCNMIKLLNISAKYGESLIKILHKDL